MAYKSTKNERGGENMSKTGNAITNPLENRLVPNSLSERVQRSLFELIGTYGSAEEAYDMLVGGRPQCSSITKDNKEIEDIEDNTVGFCLFWEKA